MLSGSILDVYPDFQKNVMVTWLLQRNGAAARVEETYEPSFYVYSSSKDISELARILEELPQVKQVQCTAEKLVLGSSKRFMVLEVVPKNLRSLHTVAKLVDCWGGFHAYQLFNVDLRLPSRYLQERGVFCHAWVRWDGKRFVLDDQPWALDYEIPLFTKIRFDVRQDQNKPVTVFHEPVASIRIDDEVIEEENEVDTLLGAVNRIREHDPDIILTENGDNVLFPFLYHRARVCGIEHLMSFGRDQNPQGKSLRPTKEGKSYFSYGRIIYRPAFYTLLGRIHLDRAQSFFYGESGLRGLVDVARCSGIPLQLLSRLGPGTAISQIEVNAALEKGFLVPWKKAMPEVWKTAEELLIADRGGLILDPVVGLHEDVVELDYASLYPSIMLHHNISPETVLCSCCPDSRHRVPQLGYHICVRQKGLLPEVLEPILFRRFCFKARAKNSRYDHDVYNEMQKAWKWVLVVCFGYTGYRNARYGRIECHESITAFSRDILVNAIAVVEHAGFEVLHGIIDSLWVKKVGSGSVRLSRLCRMISERTGVRMDVEGRYKWIVFLPSKGTGVGALTRYYGLFEDGGMKIRGVELRQHNTPEFLKHAQRDMLKVLAQAKNASEFRECIPAAVNVLQEYAQRLINGDIDHNDLVFTTSISRDIAAYKVNTFVKSALLQLRDLGIQVQPGQSVRYLVADEHTRSYQTRVCVAERMTGAEPIDRGFYLRQLAKCGESLLIPFGYTVEKLFLGFWKMKK